MDNLQCRAVVEMGECTWDEGDILLLHPKTTLSQSIKSFMFYNDMPLYSFPTCKAMIVYWLACHIYLLLSSFINNWIFNFCDSSPMRCLWFMVNLEKIEALSDDVNQTFTLKFCTPPESDLTQDKGSCPAVTFPIGKEPQKTGHFFLRVTLFIWTAKRQLPACGTPCLFKGIIPDFWIFSLARRLSPMNFRVVWTVLARFVLVLSYHGSWLCAPHSDLESFWPI